LGRSFIVRKDHQSLKFLEQKVGTPFQQEWITKLLGYDFTVEYKRGDNNRVADALSRREAWDSKVTLSLLSMPTFSWVANLKVQYKEDEDLQSVLAKWHNNELDTQKFSLKDGLLFYKNKILIRKSPQLKAKILLFVHSDLMAGCSGYERTLNRAKRDFYWKCMRKDIKKFIRKCDVCQQNKHENTSPAGLLQPLPILTRVWVDIFMDFVEGLLLPQGHSVILVVVDHLSK
jgi:hypothetical protein